MLDKLTEKKFESDKKIAADVAKKITAEKEQDAKDKDD